MTPFDHIILFSALASSVLAAIAVIALSFRVNSLWKGSEDRAAVEAVKSDRPEFSRPS